MDKDIARYFFRKYQKSGFRIPFGRWPDFKTKEEVDEWLKETERMTNNCPLDPTRPENYPCSRGDCDCEVCSEEENGGN